MQIKGTLKQGGVIAVLALLGTVAIFLFHPRMPAWYEVRQVAENEITLQGVSQLEGKVIWIDARSEKDFEAGHVEGALQLNQEAWADLLWKHRDVIEGSQGTPVIVYCDGKRCKRSGEVAERLRTEMGLSPVYVLKGDWRER